MDRPPTSVDVARLSGVSQPTVSYVLNNTPGKKVSGATRERVLRAAAELDYTPSRAAQTLARGRSKIVVLNAPTGPTVSIAGAFYSALSRRLDNAGWTLLSHFAPPRDAHEHLIRLVSATGADAVLDAYGDAAILQALAAMGVQTIPLITPRAWRFTLERPVELQLSHLVERGHRQIVLVQPAIDDEAAASAGRWRAAEAWLTFRGLPRPSRVTWTGDLAGLGQQLGVAVDSGVTAVAAHNDDTAIPVIAAAASVGLTVPRQLAVVGVDDTVMASLTVPPLSTVRPSTGAGALERLAEWLLAVLNGASADAPEPTATFELIQRGST